MNIIIFGEVDGRGRRWTLTLAQVVAVGFLLFVVLPMVAGGTAFWLHHRLVARPAANSAGAALASTARKVQQLRVLSQAELTVLAHQVGALAAQTKRLDVLGTRLSQVAGVPMVELPAVAPMAGAWDGPLPARTVAGVAALATALRRVLVDRRIELAALTQVIAERRVRVITTPGGWPVQGGWISSPFGPRPNPFTGRPGFHPGVDIAAPIGTPVHAMAAGVVIFASQDGGFGRIVKVFDGRGQVTMYAHLSTWYVHVGEIIHKRQLIGRVGDSGYSTGPHLHFEVLSYGTPINPIGFLHPADRH
ncbi:MAG: M23 family metallopeptidase [Acidiferrobacter sp.]